MTMFAQVGIGACFSLRIRATWRNRVKGMGNNFGKKYTLFFRILDKDQLKVGSRIGRINPGSSSFNESRPHPRK